MAERRIALFLGSLSGGGAERIVLELAGALAKRGYAVDLVVCRLEGALVPEIPGGVRPIELGTAPRSAFLCTLLRLPARTWLTLLPLMLRKSLKKIRSLPFLEDYLGREQPDVILASTHVPNLLAVWAVKLSGLPIRTVLKQDNSLARSLADSTDPLRRKLPRLHPQKDYPTLLRAFATLRKTRNLRLAIMGEGHERPRLEKLIQDLGIGADVRLLGFQPNPFAFMARAAVFVLSSAWEGLGNVLIEALACGCPVVSTDCPHGPSEILEQGRYGALVPVGDPAKLARAIDAALERPGDADAGLMRARDFDMHRIADQYVQLFSS